MEDAKRLKIIGYELRKQVLSMIYKAKTGHIGGDFSVMDILTVLYFYTMNIGPENIEDPNRDRFVLSKGHSVEAYYAVLAKKGFFSKAVLMNTFSAFGTEFIGHPNCNIPGIEMNSGSLGHGLSVCTGMALAGKRSGSSYRVYTVIGDGEAAEGSVWEGAMAAAHYKLDNLCAVLDRNRLQISGTTEAVMAHENMDERFRSFGWNVIMTDGHNTEQLVHAFDEAKSLKGRPTLIIAETIKGCGVSFMENQAAWHHKVPNAQEYIQAMEELSGRAENVR